MHVVTLFDSSFLSILFCAAGQMSCPYMRKLDSVLCVDIKGIVHQKRNNLFTHPNLIKNQDDFFIWNIKYVFQNVYAALSGSLKVSHMTNTCTNVLLQLKMYFIMS